MWPTNHQFRTVYSRTLHRKFQNSFWINQSTTSQILTICQIIEVCANYLETTLLFVNFSKAFHFIHGKNVANTSSVWSPQRNTVVTLLYSNMENQNFCSSDEDTDCLDIFTGVLLGDTLAPYLFIICLDYI